MKYVTGDISKAPEMFIVHGCNMQGKMNSGVAKALRDKYPSIYKDYLSALPLLSLGNYVMSFVDGRIIGNLLTQKEYGYDGEKYASLSAINKALELFIMYEVTCFENPFGAIPIATPKLGCGRGGMEWDEVRPLLEKLESVYDVEFIVYDVPDKYSK